MTTFFNADSVAALPGPSWLARARLEAWERFEAAGLPTEAEDLWRYSPIEELDLDAFRPVSGPLTGRIPGCLDGVVPRRSALAVVDRGTIVSIEVDPAVAGLDVLPLVEAPGSEDLFGSVARTADSLGDLATAFSGSPLLVRVAPEAELDAPVVVVHWAGEDALACFPRTFVQVGRSARSTVVEVVASGAGAVLSVPVAELSVGEDAELGYLGIQVLGTRAWQLAHQASVVERGGTLDAFGLALGGAYARLRTESHLVGAGGSTRLSAAYLAGGSQVHDFRTLQEHGAPRTRSDLLFKGAVTGGSRSVYSGLIKVLKGAVGTDAFQTNRNLVLSDGAHADSVPNLDIEENDVRCSHASAVGPVDPDQRYYLESRGLPPEVADRLIVLGFFDDIVRRSPVRDLAPAMREAIASKLAEAWRAETAAGSAA